MNLARSVMFTLLTCTAALAAGKAAAQPRSDPKINLTTPEPVTDPAAIAEWLRRLAGRFRFEGVVQVVYDEDEAYAGLGSSIKGKGDCVAVGKGPGVQCMLNVVWQDIYALVFQKAETKDDKVDNSPTGNFEVPGGVSYLDPSMALFGIDPRNAQASYLLVNQKGLPEGGPGAIAGNTATFKTPCVNAPALFQAMKPQPDAFRTCDRIFRIESKPESKLVYWTVDIEINEDTFTRIQMTLRREAAEDAANPSQPAKK